MKTFDERLYKDRVNALAYTNCMGMRLVSARDGKSVAECRVQNNLKKLSGMSHSAVIGTLVEECIAAALRSLIPPSTGLMTIEHSITVLEPVLEGKLTAFATIVRLEKAIAVGTAEIRNAGGVTVAIGSATISLITQRGKVATSPGAAV